jgi:hypothetical protein
MSARTYAQVNIRYRDMHLSKEHFRHVFIVMLSGMHQKFAQLAIVVFPDQPTYDCGFYKLWSGTNNRY